MTPTNDRPEWACAQWANYEHNWHDCPACLVAYEIMIENAQDDLEPNASEHRIGALDG